MSLGIIARCDNGGLGAITQEVYRHLDPDRTLIVDLGPNGRGDCNETDPLGGMLVAFAGGIADTTVEWLCAPGIDVLWSAETFYDDDKILRAARANGVRTVVHAMPELAPWAIGAPNRAASAPRPAEILIPTRWRAETLPGAKWLPIPVDYQPDRARVRDDGAVHLFHPTGAAMLDRNGTDILLAALPYVSELCRLTIRAERPIAVPSTRVHVDVVTTATVDYWDAYPSDIDLLVLPRRYGGLSLPAQECAALGVPAVMLSPDPYTSEKWVRPVPVTRSRPRRMKGGRVEVFDASPVALAAAIDELVRDVAEIRYLSERAVEWARVHAWDGPLGDAWCETLSADCAREVAA